MQRGSENLVSDSRESGNCERAVFRGDASYTWKSPKGLRENDLADETGGLAGQVRTLDSALLDLGLT